MKNTLLILLCLSLSHFSMAQEAGRQREMGLIFSSLNNFGLTMKTGTDKALWRFNSMLFSGGSIDEAKNNLVNKQSHTGFGVNVGKEFRKRIADNFDLRMGADLSFVYAQSKTEDDDKSLNNSDKFSERTTYQPGINLVMGFNYLLHDNIVLGVELLPGFNYITGTFVEKNQWTNNGEEVKNDISGFNYGFSNNSALLTIAYRF